MYPGSIRCNSNSSSNLPAQNFASTTPYADYMGFHQMQSMDSRGGGQPSGPWGANYGLQREDWNAYDPGISSTATPAHLNGSSPGQVSYSSADYSGLDPAGSRALASVDTINTEQISPRHSSYEWMRKTVQSTSTVTNRSLKMEARGNVFPMYSIGCQRQRRLLTEDELCFPVKRENMNEMEYKRVKRTEQGKTRTREKYRVVYTDHQRLELEKEFHYNRYITIRRKSELAAHLRLSERQVKIWFQNRRAKERKLMKKKMTSFDGSSLGSIQSDSGSMSPIQIPATQTHAEIAGTLFPPPPPPPPPPPLPLTMNSLQRSRNIQQVVSSQ